MATTPKGSHNKNNGAIVRHLRSRPLHSYTHRRSRPAVTIVRPLWGLTVEVLVPSAILFPFYFPNHASCKHKAILQQRKNDAPATPEQCFHHHKALL